MKTDALSIERIRRWSSLLLSKGDVVPEALDFEWAAARRLGWTRTGKNGGSTVVLNLRLLQRSAWASAEKQMLGVYFSCRMAEGLLRLHSRQRALLPASYLELLAFCDSAQRRLLGEKQLLLSPPLSGHAIRNPSGCFGVSQLYASAYAAEKTAVYAEHSGLSDADYKSLRDRLLRWSAVPEAQLTSHGRSVGTWDASIGQLEALSAEGSNFSGPFLAPLTGADGALCSLRGLLAFCAVHPLPAYEDYAVRWIAYHPKYSLSEKVAASIPDASVRRLMTACSEYVVCCRPSGWGPETANLNAVCALAQDLNLLNARCRSEADQGSIHPLDTFWYTSNSRD